MWSDCGRISPTSAALLSLTCLVGGRGDKPFVVDRIHAGVNGGSRPVAQAFDDCLAKCVTGTHATAPPEKRPPGQYAEVESRRGVSASMYAGHDPCCQPQGARLVRPALLIGGS